MEDFRSCLADLGLSIQPVPADANARPRLDMVTRDLDFSDPEVADAVTECSGILGAGALDLVTSDAVRRVVIGRLESFSRCVRARGVQFPDPTPGFNGVGSPYPVADIPYSDQTLAGAVSDCLPSVLSNLPSPADES